MELDKKSNERWVALDAMKAVAVLVMISWHLSLWWVGQNTHINISGGRLMVGETPWPFLLQIIVAFSGNFSMSIPIVAGVALYLFLDKWQNKKTAQDENHLVTYVFKRALVIAALGYIMQFLAWGADYWYFWNVLQLISVSMIIIMLFMLYSSIYLLAASGLAAIISAPLMRNILGKYSSYWTFAIIGDKLGNNIWAFFPWYGIIVYGFVLTYFYLKHKRTGKIRNLNFILILSSLIIIVIAILDKKFFYAVDLAHPWGSMLFQPPTLTIFAQIAVFNIALACLDFYFSKAGKIKKYGIINSLSRGILWIYLAHMIVAYRLIGWMLANGYYNVLYLSMLMIFIFALSYFIGVLTIIIKEKGHKNLQKNEI